MNRIVLALSIAFLASASGFAEESGRKTATLPVILNLVPGMGVGSFVQGDRLGGFVCAAGDLGGGLIALSAFLSGFLESSEAERPVSRRLYLIGAGIYCGSKAFSIIRPISFARRYNASRGPASLSFAPSLAALGGGPARLALVPNLAY